MCFVRRLTRCVNVIDFPKGGAEKPRLMKIAYETVKQKIKVLRAKMALKGNPIFDRVYPHRSKSKTELLFNGTSCQNHSV